MARWELVHEITKSLGIGWKVDASGLQQLGFYKASVSGPGGMRLSFTARTEKLDPSREQAYPPLGRLQVNAIFPLQDSDLSASALSNPRFIQLWVVLEESSAEEIANEIGIQLLPIYADFLAVIARHRLQTSLNRTNLL